jgi:F-type H+-transporting ATPase subunit gamma
MSLLEIRNRIKAINVIKKTIFSMRTLSMSLHTQFKEKLQLEKIQLEILEDIYTNHIVSSVEKKTEEKLYIFVGSDKGLCGSFNSQIIELSKRIIKNNIFDNSKYVILGKKIKIQQDSLKIILESSLNKKNLKQMANHIIELALLNNISEIHFLSMDPKTIFLSEPQVTILELRNKILDIDNINYGLQDKYIIGKKIISQYFAKKIYILFLKSFVAEQAARFVAMDNASQNAEEQLEMVTRKYYKKRQMQITSELQTISGSI